MKLFENENIELIVNDELGYVSSLKFGNEKINWLISEEILNTYGYIEASGCFLGKSFLCNQFGTWDTSQIMPTETKVNEKGVSFSYKLGYFELIHHYELQKNKLNWTIKVINCSKDTINFDKLYHWLPTAYVMHEDIDKNLEESCSFVPSLGGSLPYIICKKRNGIGNNLVIINQSNKMKSTGSLCKYKNLFFEKSAPSLRGLVLHNVVNAYSNPDIEKNPAVDWPYRDMYKGISISPNEAFYDSYQFLVCENGKEKETLVKNGIHYIEYSPTVMVDQPITLKILDDQYITGYDLYYADETGQKIEKSECLVNKKIKHDITISGLPTSGERKLVLRFEDGSWYTVIFVVYSSMKFFVDAFSENIYNECFEDDSSSAIYAAYHPASRQGETCAKGSLLLYKNLISESKNMQIQQVERNAVYYLRKRWLDEDFKAIKQYPGGFARIIDLDYLILEFYLLSMVSNDILLLNNSNTYLLWAYRTAAYRYENTPDKFQREFEEVRLASMISWLQIQMPVSLRNKGYEKEARHLEKLWQEHIKIQLEKINNNEFIQTEHYFDNAGISVIAETLLNSGEIEKGLQAADLLLHNVADSNDYRSFAPDRWWEALASMYHNLWAVFAAKAMLTAYEKSLDNRYLFSAYKAMMPMFYNYDYTVLSSLNKINKGEGVSAYCITSPNLNNEYASRNRFGQSIFKDDFFKEMDLIGDDWDMGADMLVYLTTFGQKCYVTSHENEIVCVNGELTGNIEEMQICSHAAYPSQYYIQPFEYSIIRGTKEYILKSITIVNGACTKVVVEGNCTIEDVHILQERNGCTYDIYPIIIIE